MVQPARTQSKMTAHGHSASERALKGPRPTPQTARHTLDHQRAAANRCQKARRCAGPALCRTSWFRTTRQKPYAEPGADDARGRQEAARGTLRTAAWRLD